MISNLLKRRILGEATWALVGQVGSGIILLVGTRILTELVQPEVFGQVALLVGIVALGVSIFSYPLISAGLRLLPDMSEEVARRRLRESLARLTRRSMILAALLSATGGGVYCFVVKGDPWLFLVSGLLLMVTVNREFEIHLLIGDRRQREASLWQTTDSIARSTFAVVLVLWGGANPTLVLLGYVVASAVTNGLWSLLISPRALVAASAKPVGDRNTEREILAYAWPLFPLVLLSWFSSLGDRYIIGIMMTASDVGLYAAAYTLINEAFNRSTMVIQRTFQPVYFLHFSQGKHELAFRVFGIWLGCVIVLGIVGVLALVLLKDQVAMVLLAEKYHSASVLMPVIGAGCVLQSVGAVFSQTLLATKETKLLLIGRLCGAVTGAITIPLMVKFHGLMGAAVAAPVYFGVEAIALAFLARSWSPMPGNMRQTFAPFGQ